VWPLVAEVVFSCESPERKKVLTQNIIFIIGFTNNREKAVDSKNGLNSASAYSVLKPATGRF